MPRDPASSTARRDPRLLYSPATIRSNENVDDEMEKVARVLAATAVYVCRRKLAELALS